MLTVPVNTAFSSSCLFTVISLMVGQASWRLSRTAMIRTPSTPSMLRPARETLLVLNSWEPSTSVHWPPLRYWTLLASMKSLPPPWMKVTDLRSKGLLLTMPK
ncbi:Uncharacterised protein [Collinsella intestinalis]|nr:Uncharacterised protein [Collinsella intestinalis]